MALLRCRDFMKDKNIVKFHYFHLQSKPSLITIIALPVPGDASPLLLYHQSTQLTQLKGPLHWY